MPRKRTHEDTPRTHMVSARLRPETYARLTEEAANLGLSRAGYIEHLVENKRVEASLGGGSSLSVPLLNELKRLGNNLNQITHAVNSGLPPDTMMAAVTLRDLLKVLLDHELAAGRSVAAPAPKPTPKPTEPEQRIPSHDPPASSTGHEFQGRLRLYFARRLQSQDG